VLAEQFYRNLNTEVFFFHENSPEFHTELRMAISDFLEKN